MSSLTQFFVEASHRARGRRDSIFGGYFPWIGPHTRILDLGSENGSNIARVLSGFNVTPANVHIADLDERAIQRGKERYGFTPVLLGESAQLPFAERWFDLVYCSSVIEHVTIPKHEVWSVTSGKAFKERSALRQQAFANEIRRVGRCYFVQTPNRGFPIESHTWLPLVGYFPRPMLTATLRVSNRLWIKRTAPDWNLLTRADMQRLFPDAEIVGEKAFGMTKSWMAIRADANARTRSATRTH